MKTALALAVALPCSLVAQDAPSAEAVLAAFPAVARRADWPGFDPLAIPRAVYDGRTTWLQDHPGLPDGFVVVEGKPRLARFEGRHDAMRANSSAEIGGVTTATLLLDPAQFR